jgi:von Willebrand factor type A domain
MVASIVFLSPAGALVAFAAVIPVAAFALAERRVATVRRTLRLEAPRGGADLVRAVALAAVVLVLGLAAAQPAWASRATQVVRTDAQVLFVVDTSESMGASSGAQGRTRLERAKAEAKRLRAAIPEIPAGVATLTDRVLPALLPVPDPPAFDATLAQAITIGQPPPRELNDRATNFEALAGVPASNYFAPSARKRVIVLLTDGETVPYDFGAVRQALREGPGTGLVVIRVWKQGEGIYAPSGKADPNYRADPQSEATVEQLADATDGRAFGEGRTADAARALRSMLETGPTRSLGRTEQTHPLGPYVALLALAPLAFVFRARR